MNLHYPNGKRYAPTNSNPVRMEKKSKSNTYANRGMTLEDDINETNQFYLDRQIAIIHKKPTPLQIVKVDYPKRSAAVIKEAYFKQASTTDYNGVYKGRYIDFEAKETMHTTSFPLKNFHEHQIRHMKSIISHNGLCFVLLRFSLSDEIYLLEAKYLLHFWERMKSGGRKSITKKEIEDNGHYISLGFHPRIDYIKVVESLCNNNLDC